MRMLKRSCSEIISLSRTYFSRNFESKSYDRLSKSFANFINRVSQLSYFYSSAYYYSHYLSFLKYNIRNFFKYNVLYVLHKDSYYHSTASSMGPTNFIDQSVQFIIISFVYYNFLKIQQLAIFLGYVTQCHFRYVCPMRHSIAPKSFSACCARTRDGTTKTNTRTPLAELI